MSLPYALVVAEVAVVVLALTTKQAVVAAGEHSLWVGFLPLQE
jgi:hypothetical protein